MIVSVLSIIVTEGRSRVERPTDDQPTKREREREGKRRETETETKVVLLQKYERQDKKKKHQ